MQNKTEIKLEFVFGIDRLYGLTIKMIEYKMKL